MAPILDLQHFLDGVAFFDQPVQERGVLGLKRLPFLLEFMIAIFDLELDQNEPFVQLRPDVLKLGRPWSYAHSMLQCRESLATVSQSERGIGVAYVQWMYKSG